MPLKCEHNFCTNSIHYLNGMSSQVSQLVHDVGQDPAQQLVDNDQHGDYQDETCFGDLPGLDELDFGFFASDLSLSSEL